MSGWQCASRTCCWSSSLSFLEEDWLPLLEIRLLLKRSEAATVTHAFKVSSSSVQVGFKWSVLPEVLSRKNELAWTNEDHAHSSARAALNTRTHLQFLVLFFSLGPTCSSLYSSLVWCVRARAS